MGVELHVIFQGLVQGVGFRWTILDRAEKLGLTGTVQNLKDGTVEVYAQGSKEILEQFLEDIQIHSGFARIHSFKSTYSSCVRSFTNFRILDEKNKT